MAKIKGHSLWDGGADEESVEAVEKGPIRERKWNILIQRDNKKVRSEKSNSWRKCEFTKIKYQKG